jgi:predicted Zn-dependent protease
MGRTPWAAYLWPGLPQLWRRGSWSALALAVGAAGLVNLALAASLLWTELLAPRVRTGAWLVVAAVWAGSALISRLAESRRTALRGRARGGDAFAEATEQYLRGHWFEAECAIREMLRRDPRDLEAGLMLATLLRHTGRLGEAAEQLGRLQRLDGWEHWAMEIGRERACLAAADGEQAAAAEKPGEEAQSAGAADDASEAATGADRRHDRTQQAQPQDSTENLTEKQKGSSEPWTGGSQGSPGGRADAA